jgi:chromosome segregation ATPase
VTEPTSNETLRWHFDAGNRAATRALNQIQRAEEALSASFRRMEEAGKLTHDALIAYQSAMVDQQKATIAYIDKLEVDALAAKQKIAELTESVDVIGRNHVSVVAERNTLQDTVHQLRQDLQAEALKFITVTNELGSERERNRVLHASVTHLKEELKTAEANYEECQSQRGM